MSWGRQTDVATPLNPALLSQKKIFFNVTTKEHPDGSAGVSLWVCGHEAGDIIRHPSPPSPLLPCFCF